MSTLSPWPPRPPRPNDHRGFEIAVICALTLEADAIEALFDHHWDDDGPPFDKEPGDPNAYSTGVIGRFNVILAYMPGIGKVNAATVASNCRKSFPGIKLALVVGICGVVPFGPTKDEIVLGDVIISNGVIQYDFGRQLPDHFVRKDTLSDVPGRPNLEIRGVLAKLKGLRHRRQLSAKIADYLDILRQDQDLHAEYPGSTEDRLFDASYRHTDNQKSCKQLGCNGKLVSRSRLAIAEVSLTPAIHFGLITSGDAVMKSGEDRDRIAAAEGVIAFEMEGAGVWDSFPCVIIKGACDYADSHKSKVWQRYAAATAAACAKAFLSFWTPSTTQDQSQIASAVRRHEIHPIFLVPFSKNDLFVGREDILAQLHGLLFNKGCRNAALVGLGGIGKTQIALQFAYWVKTNKQDYSVFWMPALSRASFEHACVQIMKVCGIPTADNNNAVESVGQYLSSKGAGKWLLVVDNADDVQTLMGSKSADNGLYRSLPQSDEGRILFVTRDRKAAVSVAGRNILYVPAMGQDEARSYFKEALIQEMSSTDDEVMNHLLTLLAHLPLAITQAAAYMNENQISLTEYVQLFENTDRDRIELLGAEFQDDTRYERSQDAVAISETVPLTDSGYASTAGVVVNRQKLIEAHADDAATEYSVTSGTDFPEKNQYISKLVDHLATKTRTVKTDKETQSRVSAILPDLLKAFALRLGGQDTTSIHREAMAFIYKHRCEIAEAFNAVGYQRDEDIEEDAANSDAVGWQDRMDLLWGNREPQSLEEQPDETRARSPEVSSDTSGYLDETNTRLLAYEETTLNTVAFKWLLDRLQKELLLTPMEPETMQTIGETIVSALPLARRISRKAQPRTYRATFELEWDVFDFFRTQGYDGPPQNIIEGVITLTGCCPDAQATTCAQYLLQTWPSTSGELIEIIKIALTRGQGYLIENKLSDGTTLNVQIRDSKFLAEVHGLAATIAEIGEQLAWLGAALRTPAEDTGLAYCTPHITIDSTPFQSGNQPSESIVCLIWFTTDQVTEAPNVNGHCWQALFRNPFIVRGYPILRRAEWSTGLEAPLEIMAGLAEAHQMYHSDNRIYIKGFSTMLVPTRRCGDIICWHLLQEDGDRRISHLAAKSNQYEHIGGLKALENSRHVLGWCLEAELFTGSNQWSHSRLIHTMLPNPGPNGALFGRHVERGRAIAKQLIYFKGMKDTPPVLAYDGYVRRLQTLESQFVLFWDETDKRGWLLNGTSALLHAVESFLTEGGQDGSRGAFLFKGDDYKDLSEAHRTLSALEILNDEKYQRLPLYREGCSHTTLKSQIEDLCGILEHFIDIQLFVMKDYAPKTRPRKDLEGWDFKDLVTNHNTINSRVATLNSCGKGWVDFVRDLKAVTLFGRCFGDLIRPATQRQQTCSKWASLPTGRYYIATCVSDLAKVVESHGIYPDGHIRLSKTLFWHTPRPGSEFCQCRRSGQDASDQADCEPVQTCFPLHLAQKVKPRQNGFALAHDKGALIFGQNSEFPWIWGNLNDPQECQLNELIFPSESVDVSSKSLKDSGIGPSVARSDFESQTSSRSLLDRCLTEPSTKCGTNSIPTAAAPSLPRKAHVRNRYRVGIICALPKELMAVRALLDETHVGLKNSKDDYNKYTLGRMGPHNVVATCLAEYGTNSAARTAGDMKRSFSLRFCLLVGIGGGVPSAQHDIRLGDVVVGESVVQYDLGKETEKEGFQRKYQPLQTPPPLLKSVINSMRGDPDLSSNPLDSHLHTIMSKERMSNYRHPGSDRDILFESCTKCSSSPEPCRLPRMCQRRQNLVAKIHYGIIASGNSVIGNATIRDQKAAELKVICFEMEAAGVVNAVPCLVIRGICDYCDDKKNDEWQEYAAATAAAYAKLLLIVVDENECDSHSDTDYSPPIRAKRRRLETE
ncbi:hypothetical protein F52700_3170 [Fusarium sp. NRRL 52700]|nr:hypothetical protein F52700_3170 [Fusarium sp. NRRL 52700]